ncbi:signal peptidase I [Cryobacterium lyxosi]|nr:signal peptidase I [Cryobacterium lyxosi]
MGHPGIATKAPTRIISVIMVGAIVMLALRVWVAAPMTVVSDSMEPTVMQGSIVLVHSAAPSLDGPTVGQMVVFRSPEDGKRTLKRVAGAAGQTVAIRDGALYVDGALIVEQYVDSRQIDGTFFHRVTVPAGHLFVLGDNRAISIDSRDYGFIPIADVAGTVLWPW